MSEAHPALHAMRRQAMRRRGQSGSLARTALRLSLRRLVAASRRDACPTEAGGDVRPDPQGLTRRTSVLRSPVQILGDVALSRTKTYDSTGRVGMRNAYLAHLPALAGRSWGWRPLAAVVNPSRHFGFDAAGRFCLPAAPR